MVWVMDFVRQSWKAVVAFVGAAIVPQVIDALPAIESAIQGWTANLISAAIVAFGVWLKGNSEA